MIVITGEAGFIGSCLASKLNAIGYRQSFTSLEEGVADYVRNYLAMGHIL